MLNLKEYIKESILDDEDMVFNDDNIKSEIKKFIEDNYKCKRFTISNKSNKDGKFVVDGSNVQVANKNITSLTNNLFIWDKVGGYFDCANCKSLTSLKDAPKEVGGFYCYGCVSLKSLEGAPKKVGRNFNCHHCGSLKSLEGAPREIGMDFECYSCTSLKSLKGAPKEVGGNFDCSYCDSLASLEGAPKEVGGIFFSAQNKFSIEDIKKVVKVEWISI